MRSLGTDQLGAAFAGVRALTDELTAPLSPEDQTVQSMPDVSPTKWHRAHTTWFFEEFVLATSDAGYRRFHPDFAYLFNSYYEAVGRRHPRSERGHVSRPGVATIADYREAVDAAVATRLTAGVLDDALPLVELGLHHEQQHQELILMDIKHVLSQTPVDAAYRKAASTTAVDRAPQGGSWIGCDGGIAEIGHDDRDGFAFDNEGPRHQVVLRPYELGSRLVTNADWLAFMADDGYRRPELWLSDGWFAVQSHGWKAPAYWEADDGGHGWRVFTLGGPEPVHPDEPVCHVSYFEADAFARWRGCRLPTEAEWEVAASVHRSPDEHSRVLDLDVLRPRPAGGAGPGLQQAIGDVWEWTSSAYLPYPGFRPASGAVGEYNGKFMVNQHVLRGGSCATPPGHIRTTYRNFFPPAARWAFSGLRLARDAA